MATSNSLGPLTQPSKFGDWIPDVKKTFGIERNDPALKEVMQMYDNGVLAIVKQAEALAKKAQGEKDAKKKKALEDQAIKTHQGGLIKVRAETTKVIQGIVKKREEEAKKKR